MLKTMAHMHAEAGNRAPRTLRALSCLLVCSAICLPTPAQTQITASATQPAQVPQSASSAKVPGTVTGTVKDVGGSAVPEAHIKLNSPSSTPSVQETESDEEGHFIFYAINPGPFTLSVAEEGLQTETIDALLHSGETYQAPEIALKIASATTEVEVTETQHDLAEVVVKQEEQQRIVGVIPNFYVSYDWHAPPLDARQKFELANRSIIDPVNILLLAGDSGIQQALNSFPGYGQGASGYAKRLGANSADFVIGTELGGAILPIIFKEDPRYFYKGTGSILSRTLYAASTSVMGRTDKGKWSVSYSSIIGDFSTGAISNLYYPPSSRQGATLTIENGFLSLAFDSAGNIIQEFLLRHFTPKAKVGPLE